MLLIECPFCGPRSELEFSCGGEALLVRPRDPASASDEEWSTFLFVRKNSKGAYAERWLHAHGCGKWFHAVRNTATDQFCGTYPLSETIPAFEEARPK